MIRGFKTDMQIQQINYDPFLDYFKNRERRRKPCLMNALFEYLKYFESIYDKSKIVHSLHLSGISSILTSILDERSQSTSREDFEHFASIVNFSELDQSDMGEIMRRNAQRKQ